MSRENNSERSAPIDSLTPWNHPAVIANHKARKARDNMMRILVICCALLVLIPLGDLLLMFAVRGLESISVPLLFNNLANPNPGLSNAIIGTALLTLLSSAIAIPIGVFGGVYMAEFSMGGRYSGGLRFAADVLAGVPSIVLGYVCYLIFVIYFHWGFSALAAAIALSIIMFPYIFRTTEIALKKVPVSLKEGAIALGSTKTTMVNKLSLRFALPGIVTGILIAVGISVSETAPLLYTASFADYNPTGLIHNQPVAYLTGVIYEFYQYNTPVDVQLTLLATFLLLLIVLMLNVVARLGLRSYLKV